MPLAPGVEHDRSELVLLVAAEPGSYKLLFHDMETADPCHVAWMSCLFRMRVTGQTASRTDIAWSDREFCAL